MNKIQEIAEIAQFIPIILMITIGFLYLRFKGR